MKRIKVLYTCDHEGCEAYAIVEGDMRDPAGWQSIASSDYCPKHRAQYQEMNRLRQEIERTENYLRQPWMHGLSSADVIQLQKRLYDSRISLNILLRGVAK